MNVIVNKKSIFLFLICTAAQAKQATQTAANCIINEDGVEECHAGEMEVNHDLPQNIKFKKIDSSFRAWEESHRNGGSRNSNKNGDNLYDHYEDVHQEGAKDSSSLPPNMIVGDCQPSKYNVRCNPNDSPLTGSIGVPQRNDGTEQDKVQKIIEESHFYLKHHVLVDPLYHNVAIQCMNTNELCAYWAQLGECEKNPSYMLRGCKLACQSCEP
mmetsp:Transcript_10870/g.16222  ORF Transcript_10870/g.16222 Transcript_10870/m.16222 type:complete len:213 (+) Transcript_10870:150-788(+)|eukprot:CAMPEP_0196811444 /NCGR_PEP_ID=MMETSP1362-20130617/17594_1 /TAXON_ID=163516 /ORGANISM="Leptocylindrus danicus, Strain CCMP1856" /LENGTH=212 /DNA_ID=CAMNT_0042186741 /DNA_START=146 /DNA_END=787 /DNA_ORIENTATION=+